MIVLLDSPSLHGFHFNLQTGQCSQEFIDLLYPPEEVGHALSIVTRCLVIMAKIKRYFQGTCTRLHHRILGEYVTVPSRNQILFQFFSSASKCTRRCLIVPRGHNSQKKMDLKKVGVIFDFYLGLSHIIWTEEAFDGSPALQTTTRV